jgi:hypothetical protein
MRRAVLQIGTGNKTFQNRSLTIKDSKRVELAGALGAMSDETRAPGAPGALSNETRRSTGRYDWGVLAVDALELARRMPPGPERNEALKLASLLRCAADARGLVFAKRGRPPK